MNAKFVLMKMNCLKSNINSRELVKIMDLKNEKGSSFSAPNTYLQKLLIHSVCPSQTSYAYREEFGASASTRTDGRGNKQTIKIERNVRIRSGSDS